MKSSFVRFGLLSLVAANVFFTGACAPSDRNNPSDDPSDPSDPSDPIDEPSDEPNEEFDANAIVGTFLLSEGDGEQCGDECSPVAYPDPTQLYVRATSGNVVVDGRVARDQDLRDELLASGVEFPGFPFTFTIDATAFSPNAVVQVQSTNTAFNVEQCVATQSATLDDSRYVEVELTTFGFCN